MVVLISRISLGILRHTPCHHFVLFLPRFLRKCLDPPPCLQAFLLIGLFVATFYSFLDVDLQSSFKKAPVLPMVVVVIHVLLRIIAARLGDGPQSFLPANLVEDGHPFSIPCTSPSPTTPPPSLVPPSALSSPSTRLRPAPPPETSFSR